MIRLLQTFIFSVLIQPGNLVEYDSTLIDKHLESKVEEIVVSTESLLVINKNARFSWEAHKPLRWSDFRGAPDHFSKFAATSNTGISHTYSVSSKGYLVANSSQVRANFYPNLSWYIPKLINKTTLAHEQTHFDISELHARILRKELSQRRFSHNAKREITAIYANVEKARKAMQFQFDQETNHSIDLEKEVIWENYIAKLLKKYERWSS